MSDSVVVFGGDGYIGWPLALHLAWATDKKVVMVDNLVTRRLVSSVGSESLVPILSPAARVAAYRRESGKENLAFVQADARNPGQVDRIIWEYLPDAVVHLAQQRSAPFSMVDQEHALYTQVNNVATNLNIMFSMMRHVPHAHLLKMGTLGEYGTPNIEITEGAVAVVRHGRKHLAMFPRAGQSWYHLSKIFDTHNVLFANKVSGLKATDVMQGVVYGCGTNEMVHASLATRFDFDSVWGTVVNKYVVQAVVLGKLLIYGKGRQTRGFLSLYDSIECLSLLLEHPPAEGEYRVVNQMDETYNTVELAEKVQRVAGEFGIHVGTERVANPRVELEEHFYRVEHKLLPSIGFERTKEMEEVLREIFQLVLANSDRAEKMRKLIAPTVIWSGRKAVRSEMFPLPSDLLGQPHGEEVTELARDRPANV